MVISMIKKLLKNLVRTIIGVPFVLIAWLITLAVSLLIYFICAPVEWISTGSISYGFLDWIDDITSLSPYGFIKDVWGK